MIILHLDLFLVSLLIELIVFCFVIIEPNLKINYLYVTYLYNCVIVVVVVVVVVVVIVVLMII